MTAPRPAPVVFSGLPSHLSAERWDGGRTALLCRCGGFSVVPDLWPPEMQALIRRWFEEDHRKCGGKPAGREAWERMA